MAFKHISFYFFFIVLFGMVVWAIDTEKFVLLGTDVKNKNAVLIKEDNAARNYRQYCALCHGLFGMGEGLLPMTLKSYPNTDLLTPKLASSHEEIKKIISSCDSDKPVALECPPYGDELSKEAIDALSDFVLRIRKEPMVSSVKIRSHSSVVTPRINRGRALFIARCTVCHGISGDGDGRLAKALPTAPYDLTKSTVTDEYIAEIVINGGDFMGRSSSMPAFAGDIDDSQMKSLTLFLKSLRVNKEFLTQNDF